MAVANNNLSVLPFYKGQEYWHSRQWYTYGQVCPVMMKQDATIPFQFVVSEGLTVSAASIRRVKDDVPVRDLTVEAIQGNGYTVIVSSTHSTTPLPFGQYYYSITLSDDSVYMSDIVGVIDNESKYVRLEYWNTENMYYEGGHVEFENGFHFILYVQSTIGKPEYEFQEQITERLGYKFIDSQISNKVYNFVFPANEALCDAIRLIRMCDYINIKTSLDTYNAIYFSNEVKWEDNGDIAAVTVSFETDTIIQKLENINRTQIANFYNALLANIDEPIMFDEDVVAQYYQEFQTTGTVKGKLIRQLNEATEDDVKENDLYLAVDFGEGEAKKVRLSVITKLFGSSFFELDDKGNVRVKDGKNFYTEGEISAGGYSEEGGTEPGGGGGIDETKLWQILGTPGTQQIDSSHLQEAFKDFTPDLSNYVTSEALANTLKGYATSDTLNAHTSDTNIHLSEEDREKLSWFAKDEQGNIYIKGGLNFYTEGEISAGGYSDEGGAEPGGGGTGIDETKLWQILGDDGTEQIAKNHLTTALSDYITASSANSLFATKTELSNYATSSDLAQTNANVTAISTKLDDFLEGSDTDTIINKWKELEAFLSGMSESDNLADILSNKADTALVEEQLGYKLDKSVFDDLFEKVLISEGKYAIKAKYDFYSEGEISAGGYSDEGGSTGGGSIFGIKVNGSTYEPVDGYITIPDYPTELSWGAITGKPTTLAGYGITDAYTEAESDSMFVIKSGDVMTGTLTIQYGGDYKLVFNNTDGERLSVIDFRENGTSYGYLSMGSTALSISCPNNLITVGGHAVLHEGNYTSTLDTRYVKKSGDTMSGALIFNSAQDQLIVLNSERDPYIEFQLNGVRQAVFGGVNNVPAVYTNTWHEIWHAGNDGSGSGLDADTLDGRHRSNLYTSIQDWLGAIENGEVTITINGDANTYYPVVIKCRDISKRIYSQVSVYRNLGEQCASYSGNHSNGTSSMWLVYDYRSTWWDGNGGLIRTMLRSMPYASLCAHTNSDGQEIGALIVYLRGGGTVYHIASTGGVECNVYYSTTNIGSSQYPYNVSPLTSLGNAGIYNTGSYHLCTDLDGNASSASKLETPRTIWGQSFDGTGSISGQLSGCTRITNSTSQPIYLGNADNSSWVYTQGIASQQGESYWAINQAGNSWFKKVNISYTRPNEGSFPLNVQGTVSSTSLSTQNIRIECDNSGALSGRGSEINNYNSHLYLQHNTTTNLICCMGGGNMGIGTYPSYKLHVAGDIKSTSIFTDSWFRSNGNTGWYSETYGGGIYMEDTTWVRVYNNKGLYVTGTILADGYNNHGNNYGYIVINKLGGYYAAIGGNGAIDEIKFGKSGIDGAWVTGNINWRFEGNIVATGEITAGSSSDVRLKTILGRQNYAKRLLSLGMVVDYEYNDLAFSRNVRSIERRAYTGLIYQDVKKVLPQMAGEDADGYGYLNYIHTDYINLIAGALQQTILKQETIEQRVVRLEKENAELKNKIAKLANVN